MKTVCIYHSRDLDGWMSGAIVRMKYPEVELVGWDYGMPYPEIEEGASVVMADISFPMPIMLDVAKKSGWKLTWIDHHASAIKEYEEFTAGSETFMSTSLNSKFAACELTWQYFFKNEPIPEMVRLLGRYDCFGHKGTDEEQKVLEFQYGARSVIRNTQEAYEYLTNNHVSYDFVQYTDATDRILDMGRAIYKYLCTEVEQKYAKRFDIILDVYKFGCVNDWRLNPVNFGIDYHNDGYDGFACFWYENGQFVYSLYNDNGMVDCSVIAKARGGGGHKGASGFRSNTIIEE